jgi:hypothetical protein
MPKLSSPGGGPSATAAASSLKVDASDKICGGAAVGAGAAERGGLARPGGLLKSASFSNEAMHEETACGANAGGAYAVDRLLL